jgi:hypothetical protein
MGSVVGHGAQPRYDKLNISQVATTFAWIGNLRDALDKIEKNVENLHDNPDSKEWEELKNNKQHFLDRSKGFVFAVNNLIRSQDQV